MKKFLIKAFNSDFNWDSSGPAKPGLFGQADPAAHVRWYQELGANVIQTFCVTYNGYAWYKDSSVAPVTPDMTHDFLPEITDLAHKQGMMCLGYFNLLSNPVWKTLHPETVYAMAPMEDGYNVGAHSIIYTDEYLDYFAKMIQDVLRKTDIDGFMVDWLKPPDRKTKPWLPREKQLYRELMHRQFPIHAKPNDPDFIEFDRLIVERAWVRMKEAVASVRPAIIWTNHPFDRANDPLWNGHRVLKETDWILNEAPDVEFLDWLGQQVGPETRIIQNLCGWKNHDASALSKIDYNKFGLYGFAQADPFTTLPSADYTPACAANEKNIAIIRAAYHSIQER